MLGFLSCSLYQTTQWDVLLVHSGKSGVCAGYAQSFRNPFKILFTLNKKTSKHSISFQTHNKLDKLTLTTAVL